MTPYPLIVLLCMCDFSSVKTEILRILALNSECENTSSGRSLLCKHWDHCHVGNLGQLL